MPPSRSAPTQDAPAEVRLTLAPAQRAVVALAGVLLVALVAGIALVLLSLESTRGDVRKTRSEVVDVTSRVQRLDRQVSPLLTGVSALTKDAGAPRVRSGVRSAAAAVGRLPGLAQDARSGLQALVPITDAIARSDLAATLPELVSVVRRAQDPGSGLALALGGATRALDGLRTPRVPSQATCDRRLLTGAAIDQLGCALRTIPNARKLLSDQRRLTSRSIRIQTDTGNLVRQGITLLTDSLAIQREILGHARALDRKIPETAAAVP